jgi:hypothetical protein
VSGGAAAIVNLYRRQALPLRLIARQPSGAQRNQKGGLLSQSRSVCTANVSANSVASPEFRSLETWLWLH